MAVTTIGSKSNSHPPAATSQPGVVPVIAPRPVKPV